MILFLEMISWKMSAESRSCVFLKGDEYLPFVQDANGFCTSALGSEGEVAIILRVLKYHIPTTCTLRRSKSMG